MKSLTRLATQILIISLSFASSRAFTTEATLTPCSTGAQKIVESIELTSKHAKKVVVESKNVLTIGDNLYLKLANLWNTPDIQAIFTQEKKEFAENIIREQANEVHGQIKFLLDEGIKPEIQLMSQRIEDLLREDKEKIQEVSQKIETTIKETLQKEEVQDSIKKIKEEGKKLGKHFKKLFK